MNGRGVFMKKSYAILEIFDDLLNEKEITITDIQEKYDCSRRTALRYIRDIKDFLSVNHKELRLYYDKMKKTFLILR